jgi:enoyl-[acyl-carrier protein] reductase I
MRRHAGWAGSIRICAVGGIDWSDVLRTAAEIRALPRHLVELADVGALAAFLVSGAVSHFTGTIIPTGGGQHVLA